MSFHFDARADSSDDDETTGTIDLAAWKLGVDPTTRQTPKAPVVPMMKSRNDSRSGTGDSKVSTAFLDRPEAQGPSSRTYTSALATFKAVNHSNESSPDRWRSIRKSMEMDDNAIDVIHGHPVDDVAANVISRKLMAEIPRDEVERGDYEDLTAGSERIKRLLNAKPEHGGKVTYTALFADFHTEKLRRGDLLNFENGDEALEEFRANPPSSDGESPPQRRLLKQRVETYQRPAMTSTRSGRTTRAVNLDEDRSDLADGSENEHFDNPTIGKRRKEKRQGRSQDLDEVDFDDDPEEVEDEDEDIGTSADELVQSMHTGRRKEVHVAAPSRNLRKRQKLTGRIARNDYDDDDDDDDDDNHDNNSESMELLDSDFGNALPQRRTRHKRAGNAKLAGKNQRDGMRHSERSTRHKANMQEVQEDDAYPSFSEQRAPVKPKLAIVREVFKPLPRNNDFRMRHYQYCDVCGHGTIYAALIECQGCSLTYHKICLGHRTSREHLVTKIGEEEFVLQCRRCVAFPKRKDPTAPDHGKCQECYQHGASCRPFRKRKTPNQEQKEREDNGGIDPIYSVNSLLINNPDNVLFRCTGCFRGFHFEHLPSRSDIMNLDMDVDAEQRFREYSRDWKCRECLETPAKVSGIIAWKPVEEDAYDHALGYGGLQEDDKAYLVRWEGMSYFRARWMPGPWVWGVTASVMRKAFAKRDDAQHPKMRTEDAIPEDYLRTDIVLDIRFTSIVDIRTEDVDKARIREVKEALIKYKGLNYEDAVWEAPPGSEDGERWTDFVVAYNDWVAGRYVRQPKGAGLKSRLEKARKEAFRDLEKKSQPENIEGGKLMEYQLQGLNWLYYKWLCQKNVILADEMGLGKTIQIIGFLATLVQDYSCYPFLVVVPNSTCPNWRREIKRWAPSLRVVAYYGSRESRDLAHRHELYPEGAKDLRCHIVVTSYDAAADENCRKFFRGVSWQALIVDEGQRLKNDKNLLYTALGALKAPFKVLLTGTPLQNNARELFNLLHFLDDTYDAAALEKQYEDLDQDKITKLHNDIRPFFLRRTKAQVLTFLPPMAQIILPVSMSLVQKKLYRNILAKNPELMKAIFSAETTLKQGDRGSLNNILIQLRKCLCHPFVYNKSIEDRNVDVASSHRNLVDASSKLKLLEMLLPKLQARGHRVLIFTQFLEMLDIVEDFMDGMQMRYHRLDGSINALIKQKRIDDFNAPNSPLFAFLLSTRAGGVGINLATADTVIILDPDFNPHQDIQALSRAHRIGQQKKVLCFQLVTRASVEERIMQIGRKKLALDHVLIQEMDADDADQTDLVSVLRHGAGELFEDSGDQDIVFDDVSIERLLDRSHMEDTSTGEDKTAETQFSFARVWANHNAAFEDVALPETTESAPDPGVWASILKERERLAAEEAAAKAEEFGRGRRARMNNVDYTGANTDEVEMTPLKPGRKRMREGSESDTDFQADDSDDEDDAADGERLIMAELNLLEVNGTKQDAGRKKLEAPAFRRVVVQRALPPAAEDTSFNGFNPVHPQPGINSQQATFANSPSLNCRACNSFHPVGRCPLKLAGVEHCGLCGIAHFGHARVCPHIQSETQVRAMLEALKYSNEPEHLVNEAKRYLRGLKGNLVQLKKQKEAKNHVAREPYLHTSYDQSRSNGTGEAW